MSASEEAYKKLTSAVNITFYIGPKDAEAIKKACCPAPKAEVEKKVK